MRVACSFVFVLVALTLVPELAWAAEEGGSSGWGI